MLRHTFLHLPKIGRVTEARLWEAGVRTWEDYLEAHRPGGLNPGLRELHRLLLQESRQALEVQDAGYFAARLPPSDHWRLYADFQARTVYLDIETTGFSETSSISVAGLYDAIGPRLYIHGENLEAIRTALAPYEILVTYNDKTFDLPILLAQFPDMIVPPVHLDLRYPLRRLGFRGGLKTIEQSLGVGRDPGLKGADSWMAPLLWRAARWGSRMAYDTLLRYNLEDVASLKVLAERAYNLAVRELPLLVQPLLESERPSIPIPFDPDLIAWLKQGAYPWSRNSLDGAR